MSEEALAALELEGHRLWVAPAFEATLREELLGVLRAPEEAPGARVVKQNRVRTVVRLETGGGPIFFKRFRVLKAFDRLLHTLKPSAAQREWRGLRALRAAGVRVPDPLLFGEERASGALLGSVLATREVEGAQELTTTIDAWRAAGDEERRPAVIRHLATIVRAIFAAGGDHPDLHLGNFLLAPDDVLVALDLHSLRLRGGPLAPARRDLRLEKLAHSFGVCNPDVWEEGRRELRWFCEAYVAQEAAEQGGAARGAEALADRLQAGANRLEARRLVSRDRRCLVESTGFAVTREADRVIYRRREVPRGALLAAIEAEPEAVVHAHPRGRSRLVRVARPDGFPGEGPLIVKHYAYPKLRKQLAALAGPLALRAWRAARACEVRGAPIPTHYGLVLEGRAWPRGAALVIDLLPDVSMVHVLLEEDGFSSLAARRALARRLGRVMGRFHSSGLIHRDLAVQNLLVRPRGDDWDVWVIDLDEVRTGELSRRDKLRALTHLGDLPAAATRSDRLRFFRAYLEAGGRRVLAPELQAWGERGLGRRVGEALAQRAEAKRKRLARRGHARPRPIDLATLEGASEREG